MGYDSLHQQGKDWRSYGGGRAGGVRKKEDALCFTKFKIKKFSNGFIIVEFRRKMRAEDISLGEINLYLLFNS